MHQKYVKEDYVNFLSKQGTVFTRKYLGREWKLASLQSSRRLWRPFFWHVSLLFISYVGDQCQISKFFEDTALAPIPTLALPKGQAKTGKAGQFASITNKP